MKDRLRKLIPSRDKLREFSALRPVAHLLNRPELSHLNRRGVSGAAFVGLFSAFIPVPSQMLLAAIMLCVDIDQYGFNYNITATTRFET